MKRFVDRRDEDLMDLMESLTGTTRWTIMCRLNVAVLPVSARNDGQCRRYKWILHM